VGAILRSKAIISVLAAILLLSHHNTPGESASQSPRANLPPGKKLFGIMLRPSSSVLLETVERLYGKPVREEETDKFPPGKFGESTVDEEGTPVIIINSSRGRTERNIIHELYHLRLRAEGSPILTGHFAGVRSSRESRQLLSSLIPYFHDFIQHWIFYPEMRKMGLDPAADIKSDYERILGVDKFQTLNESDVKGLALEYWKTALELDDPELLGRIGKWYERKGWGSSLAKGKQLKEIVESASPRQADEEVDALLRCLNAFYEGEYKFELEARDKEMHGKFLQRIAVIRILPGG